MILLVEKMKRFPIVIADYDSNWPNLYEEKKEAILKVIGSKVKAIEHIGSTSVPGLGAKPIIDIFAGVGSPGAADDCLRLLRDQLGVIDFNAEPENSEWFYCIGDKTHPEGNNTLHLHLVLFPSKFWNKHLRFRDILRTHPDIARDYYKLKVGLAEKYRTERMTYNQSKTTFIEAVLEKY
jgi:GrpB-like predicted nucleotidyltransferase (UPF0157 family)